MNDSRKRKEYPPSHFGRAPKLVIVSRDPKDLRPRPRNPRTHGKKQIRQIGVSIREFGFVNPVLIDSNDGIIAGHGRVEAAKLIGMNDIPTVRVDHLTPAQICAYVIADNKLAENAGWDQNLLALELQELSVEPNFDATVTGFETAEIDLLVRELGEDAPDDADDLPEIDRSAAAVSQRGDLWRIGDHLLLCGDALSEESHLKLLGTQQAQMVFTDPPYNVAIAGNVSGLGKVKHREFAMASGEMSRPEFTGFLGTVFALLARFSADGSIHFVCMDWRHSREVLEAADGSYGEPKNLCVWAKTNAGMGSLYRSQHELVFVFKNGSAPHINNVELGRFGRNRTNVWNYAGANTFGKERDAALAMHPTVKPLALVADAILDCSKRGGLVLDAFAGSGTTLLAAQQTGRHGRGIEIDPYYVDTTIRRFAEVHGIDAVHVESGLVFQELSAKRSSLSGEKRHARNTETKNGNNRQPKGRGRGNPPKHTQFRKGMTGNPKGRPKGSKNLATIIAQAAGDQVSATIDGKSRKISKLQATAMQLATQAAGGNPAMVGRFLDWIDKIEARAAASRPIEFPFGDADLVVLRAIYERMKLCDADNAAA